MEENMSTPQTIERTLKQGINLLATLVIDLSSLVGNSVSFVRAQAETTDTAAQQVRETQTGPSGFPTAAEAINSLVEAHNVGPNLEYSYQVIGEVHIEGDWAYSDAIKISRSTGEVI